MTKIGVSIPEAVEMTGIGRSSIYRLIRERKLTPRKMGSRTILLVDELKTLVESLPTQVTA